MFTNMSQLQELCMDTVRQESQAEVGADAPRKEDRSVSLLRANFLMVYFALPAVLLLGVPYFLLWGWTDVRAVFVDGSLVPLLAAIVIGIVVHEAVHGLTWKWTTGKPFGVIRFGFDWKTVTPYAHCTEAMQARPYRIGAVMPLILLGILPALYALASGSAAAAGFGLFFTFAAGGDMLILWLLRDVAPDALVEDHPTRAGCYVLLPAEEGEKA
jgi:hypothetical protein